MNNFVKSSAFVFVGVVLSGCIAINEPVDIKENTDRALDQVEQLDNAPSMVVVDEPYVDANPYYLKTDKYKWLRDIEGVEIFEGKSNKGVPLAEVIRQLKTKGVNVSTSNLPLDLYRYKGFAISKTNALTALEIITTSMDLDFIVNTSTGRPFVELVPLQVSEYTLNVPDREVAFALKDNSFSGGGSLSDLLSGGTNGQNQGQGSQQTQGNTDSSENGSSTKLQSEFWKDLEKELKSRMVRLVPVIKNDSEYSNQSGSGAIGSRGSQMDLVVPIKIGEAFVNPSSGSISIHAPTHIRNEVLRYLRRLDKRLNTRIELKGQIVIVNETGQEKKGLDISTLIEFGKDYGLVIDNSIYNEISVTRPDQITNSLTTAVDGALGNAIGITGNEGLLQIFNAYVESENNIKSLYEPRLNATTGSVATFSRVTPYIFTNYQATSTTNESATTSSTQNNLVPIEFGLKINAYPTYNLRDDVIRTYIDLVQVFQAKTQTVEQIIDGEVRKTLIPIPDKLVIQTEVISKNGSLVIVGGQTIENYEGGSQGVMELKDSYLGGVFGSSSKSTTRSKYYFVFEATAVEPAMSVM